MSGKSSHVTTSLFEETTEQYPILYGLSEEMENTIFVPFSGCVQRALSHILSNVTSQMVNVNNRLN